MKIAILGAGLAGLTLANLLDDYDVTIFEKCDKIGGLCRTESQNGFTFDIGGSHVIFSRDQEALKYILDVLEKNFVKKRRNTKILYNDRLVKYPFENGIGDLNKGERIDCLYYYIKSLLNRNVKTSPPSNFRDWIYWKFGKGFADKYMIPYNEKIWKFPLENMSSEWVDGRIPDPDIKELLKAALELESEGYTHQLFFYYPKKGGIEQIICGLSSSFKGKILVEQNIELVQKRKNKWIVKSNGNEFNFDLLINTIPIIDFLKLIPEVPSNILDATNNLIANSLINVFIGIRGEVSDTFKNLSWMYIPEREKGYFHRVSFPSNFSRENAPKGHMGINIEITTMKESDLWIKQDEDIEKEVIHNLVEMGLFTSEQVCTTNTTRWLHAYVIFDLNYKDNIDKIISYLNEQKIYTCGRFAQFLYLNMDQIVKEAMKCAYKIKNDLKVNKNFHKRI